MKVNYVLIIIIIIIAVLGTIKIISKGGINHVEEVVDNTAPVISLNSNDNIISLKFVRNSEGYNSKKDVYAKDMDETTEPIYYTDEEGNLRLRPEFVAAYVPVQDRNIGEIILNEYPHNDIYNSNTRFEYEDEIEKVKKKIGY